MTGYSKTRNIERQRKKLSSLDNEWVFEGSAIICKRCKAKYKYISYAVKHQAKCHT